MKRNPALDGLRGVAALAVVLDHSILGMNLMPVGTLAVEVFFVLSGFLIGGILIDTAGTEGWFRRFYWRRTTRIWPLYLAVVAALIATEGAATVASGSNHLALWLFCANFTIPFHRARQAVNVLWSVCVEEHAYLLLPPMVRFVKRAYLPRALVLLAVASCFARLGVDSIADNKFFSMVSTPTRLDGICIGVLAAWVLRNRPQWIPLMRPWTMALWAVKILTLPTNPWDFGNVFFVFIEQPLGSLAAAGLVLSLATEGFPRTRAVLSQKPLQYLGTISFGVYMLHPLVLEGLMKLRIYPGTVLDAALAVPITIVAASISWRLFESPILRLSSPSRSFDAIPAET